MTTSEANFQTLRDAIEPQRAGYTNAIFRYLRAEVDRLLEEHERNERDANKTAPYPYSSCSRVQYVMGKRKHDLLRRWTTLRAGQFPEGFNRAPLFRDPKSDDVIDTELMSEANKITDHDFNAYATKLAGKIAKPVLVASVVGQLWVQSILVVVIDAPLRSEAPDEVQRWSTKMILNRSKLGNLFNQWPTRRCDLNK